ncbi:MAG: hypothetical protein M1833_000343 [Piccolia ochrophora]|nr:MAG: hypothetical protein M1833_000343 [Piccolia ochrophora]
MPPAPGTAYSIETQRFILEHWLSGYADETIVVMLYMFLGVSMMEEDVSEIIQEAVDQEWPGLQRR